MRSKKRIEKSQSLTGIKQIAKILTKNADMNSNNTPKKHKRKMVPTNTTKNTHARHKFKSKCEEEAEQFNTHTKKMVKKKDIQQNISHIDNTQLKLYNPISMQN